MEEPPPAEQPAEGKPAPGRLALAICIIVLLVVGAQLFINWRFQEPPAPPLPDWYLEMRQTSS